jgi:hypothetical protein
VVRPGNRPATIADLDWTDPMTSIRTALPFALALVILAGPAPAADTPDANAKKNATATVNLLKNGDFEALNPRGGAAHWINKQHAGVRAYDFRVVEEGVHGDKRSMMIRRLQKQVWGKTEQIVPVAAELAGKTVEFDVWMRGEQVGKKGYMIRVGAFAGSNLLDFAKSERHAGDSGWTKRSLRLTVPEFTSRLVVAVTLEDAGTIWIDDARLSVVAQP